MKRHFIVIILAISLCSPQSVQATIKDRDQYEKTGHVVWEAKTKEKMVAITFDDGPHPLYTPQILDILDKHNAKATFFVMGAHVVKYPNIVKRQYSEGHEIANHTFNHYYSKDNKLKEELDRTSDIIHQITGVKPSLFRPVGGRYNDYIINTAIENNYLIVLWSWHQDTYDWKNRGVNQIVNKVTSGVKPGDIILMHDAGGKRSQTVKALDKILDHLEKNGFKAVTVSELLYRTNSILPDYMELNP